MSRVLYIKTKSNEVCNHSTHKSTYIQTQTYFTNGFKSNATFIENNLWNCEASLALFLLSSPGNLHTTTI